MTQQAKQCSYCQTEIFDNFCPRCGEKKFSTQHLSYRQLAKLLWVSLTDVDGKVLSSFRILLFKPGQLLNDYCNGIRTHRLNPFQLFLFANIIYFFTLGVISQNTFNTPLDVHLEAKNFFHQSVAVQWVEQYLAESGMALSDYRKLFNQQINLLSKSLVITMLPIFALIVLVLHLRQRYIGVKSFLFATHFYAFTLLFLVVSGVIMRGIYWLVQASPWPNLAGSIRSEAFSSVSILVCVMVYLYLAQKRNFDAKPAIIFFKTILMGIGFYYSIIIYRAILFFVTYYSIAD